MTAALVLVAVLTLTGLVLRQRVSLFRWLYIPSSVIAGLLGLLVIQLARGLIDRGDTDADSLASAAGQTIVSAGDTLQSWPGFLIAVVFAGMLLERKTGSLRESLRAVARQGLMVWIIVLGQTAVGLTITWLLIQPFYDVPNAFGMLIETGFAGGHGTAAAMGEVFKHPSIQLESGLELGTLMATVGLVYGVVTGIIWINIAIRLKWIDPRRTKAAMAREQASSDTTTTTHDPQPIGYSAISHEAIDPLMLQLVWLTLAFALGMLLQWCVMSVANWWDLSFAATAREDSASQPLADRLTARSVLDFPLFIYTLFGGLAVRRVLESLHWGQVIDASTINRLTSTAMDVLVVAAIASLDLVATRALLVPLTLLLVGAAIWTAICLFVISPRVLPKEHWFALGLINYGMSTGTTATGFVLLRIVDPELESGAAEDYAMAAPLSAPFIGGGLLTVALPLLVLQQVPIAASALVMIAIVTIFMLVGIRCQSLGPTTAEHH